MLFVVVRESSHRLYSRDDAGATLSSQIAAALLIDLETVDIRRVGTHCGEYSRSGVFRVKQLAVGCASPRNDESRPSLGENGMKEATKGAASGALAHMLAVTAMLVIASILFYGRWSWSF
ncbi:hypothetical protein ACU4GH_09055 [Bradyrhizobium betae]